MTTPIADMVEQMLEQGVSHAVILLAIRTLEQRDASRDESVTHHASSRSNEAIRAARYRAKRKQNQPKTESNGVAMATVSDVTNERDESVTQRDDATNPPLSILSSSLPASEVQSGNQEVESKKEVSNKLPRARREKTRMADDWLPDAKGMKVAGDRGLRLFEIEIEITKFRNYWINRTDRDSSKPRWDLAWENWVLNVKGLNYERAGQVRTNSNAGPPQTHGDAIVTGMARYAARRFGTQPSDCDARGSGEVRGRDDAPDAIDAEHDAAPGHRTAL